MWKEVARVRASGSSGNEEEQKARMELARIAARMQERTKCSDGKFLSARILAKAGKSLTRAAYYKSCGFRVIL